MSLQSTPVSQSLDKKLRVLGYEIPDLLAIFFTLSLLNFLFGQTEMKIFLVWLPSIALAAILRIAKRGKPDQFLIHFVRFQIAPKYLSAFAASTPDIASPKRRKPRG